MLQERNVNAAPPLPSAAIRPMVGCHSSACPVAFSLSQDHWQARPPVYLAQHSTSQRRRARQPPWFARAGSRTILQVRPSAFARARQTTASIAVIVSPAAILYIDKALQLTTGQRHRRMQAVRSRLPLRYIVRRERSDRLRFRLDSELGLQALCLQRVSVRHSHR